MTDLAPTELGRLLEHARRHAGITQRDAGARAGFTEGRWRQILKAGTAPAATVVAAALAVDADPAQALAAANHPSDSETVQRLVSTAERFISMAQQPKKRRGPSSAASLADEIERIKDLPLPAAERLRVAQGVIQIFEDLAREAEQAPEPVE
jgi:hypothetical protein